ncbi:peptidylprolyl isomerase [Apibacter muscae]|uniref:Periplasmic chaperone PpiD n=1 Tax=Apibacter muscae TaxID=2509004 RepID=A0A563DHW0_9FLAO|nr:SurA N-terminal domain-containing protein [Apibacter muscae]TWP29727.1 peptidylprolyl isomerase [Apibacter muscae]
MAILGQIRKRNGLLIGFVAVALLLFLLGGIDWSRLGGKDPNVIGKVNNQVITRQEYNNQLNFIQNQYQGQVPLNFLEGQVWNTLVQNTLIKQKFNSSGFILTDDMIWNAARNSNIFNSPQYKDKNGNINVQLIKQQFEQLEQNQNANSELSQMYQQFLELKNNLSVQAMYRQYFGSYGAGLLTNANEVDILLGNRVNSANIEYVKVDYNAYQSKHPVKVTDQDLQNYINAHKTLFKIDENRTLDYVYFPGTASSSDKKQILDQLNKLLTNTIIDGDTIQAFGTVKNDSLYISKLSSDQLIDNDFNPIYRAEQQLPQAIKNWVKTAAIGQVSSVYEDGGAYVYSKLIGKKNVDSIQGKNILISFTDSGSQLKPKTPRTKEQAKAQADQLVQQLNANPNDFSKLVVQYSDDPGVSSNGGVIKLTTAQDFKGEYKGLQRMLESSPLGKYEVVEIPEGYFVIAITDRKPVGTVYKLADIAKNIEPSEATVDLVRKQANTFIQNINGKSSQEFHNVAKAQKFNAKQQRGILRFGTMLEGLGTDKDSDIIAWAFNSKRNLGDTELFITGDQGYIVARVSSLFSGGLADPSIVRKQIETTVRNELLGKIIADKINSSNQSLDQLAKDFQTTKEQANITFDNPSIGGSFEPKVGGAAFGIKPNEKSKAIEGKTGVYVIITKSITKGDSGDKKTFKEQLMSIYSQQMPNLLLQTLYQEAKIDDYRADILNFNPRN